MNTIAAKMVGTTLDMMVSCWIVFRSISYATFVQALANVWQFL